MNNCELNYALIAALYDNKTTGLYREIYYPIIKYSIFKLHSKVQAEPHYYLTNDVRNLIIEQFHIDIPAPVVENTLTKLQQHKGLGINLEMVGLYGFKVLGIQYDEEERSFDEKEAMFRSQMGEIELGYKDFCKNENIAIDNISFLDFISQNTKNILNCIDSDGEQQDSAEQYMPIVYFLKFLNENKHDLFIVANKLFWSSIIAAFLQSQKPNTQNGKDEVKTEYYLDTSIALGLLNLSTPETEQCAKEVCDIIKASGASLRIHPITIEEIKSILESVESNGAIPGSPIASAYDRRQLNSVKIQKEIFGLTSNLQALGVSVFPNLT